jgi:AAA domain
LNVIITPLTLRVPFTDGVWADELNAAGHKRVWLWDGYLAPGYLTLLTGDSRAGKTTLLSLVLAHMKAGGVLADRAVAPGKALVISEEPREDWDGRHQQLGLGHVVFFCRPFRRRPLLPEGVALLAHVADLHRRHGFGLVVVDPLIKFLPGHSEANAAVVLDAREPLQHLAEHAWPRR